MKKERVRKILRGISGLLSLVFLGLLAFQVGGRIQRSQYQRELNSRFSYAESGVSEYEDNVPIEEIDFERVERMSLTLLGSIGDPEVGDAPNVVKAPRTIRYYRNEGGSKVLEREIPQGTPLYIRLESWGETVMGYGSTSYPTYEKGWRWVRPFLTAEEADVPENGIDPLSEEEQEKALAAPYYYVKLDDLLAVEWAAYDQYDSIRQKYQDAISQDEMGRSKEEFLYEKVTFADRMMRSAGIYRSQDLDVSIWQWEDTVYVILFCVAVFFTVFVFRKRKPKTASGTVS